MKTTLQPEALAHYLARQLDHFYPDDLTATEREVGTAMEDALTRLATIAVATKPPLFRRGEETLFNHLNSDQTAIFLYLLANGLGTGGGSKEVAAKLYLLNKALHGLDVFYEVKLPRLFLFMHPVGTVLGRAEYSDCFIAMQGCTVGNIRSDYPKLGRGVVLCAGSAVLGPARVGDDVTLGAGSLVLGGTIPPNSTVTGRAKELRLLPADEPMWRNYFTA